MSCGGAGRKGERESQANGVEPDAGFKLKNLNQGLSQNQEERLN